MPQPPLPLPVYHHVTTQTVASSSLCSAASVTINGRQLPVPMEAPTKLLVSGIEAPTGEERMSASEAPTGNRDDRRTRCKVGRQWDRDCSPVGSARESDDHAARHAGDRRGLMSERRLGYK